MRLGIFRVALGTVACLLVASAAQAQCSIDNDCPGEQICEESVCAAPPTPAAVPQVQPRYQAPAVEHAPVATAPGANLALEAQAPEDEGEAREKRKKNRGPRHSTAMMVGGIVMTSFAPIALLVGTAAIMTGNPEYFVGGYAATGVLCGVGIPLIVIGGRRKPLAAASLTPWLTPQSTGLGLRLEL